MNRLEKNFYPSDSNLDRVQFLCLYLAGVMIFLLLIFDTRINAVMAVSRLGLLGFCMLFCLASFMQMRKGNIRAPSRLAVVMVVWFLVTQLIQFTSGRIYHHYTQFLPVYLLAFPFAAVTHDGERQSGLKTLAMIYITAFLVWMLYTLLLMTDSVPLSMQSHVKWDGTRLVVFRHSNSCARGFMIGIAFSMGFCFRTSRKGTKALLLLAAALMFVCLSLTNSRSAILTTCLLIGGTVFFMVYKGTWKQFLAGGMLALAIMLSLFLVAQEVFQWNSQRLMNNWAVQQSTTQQSGDESERFPFGVISLSARNVREQEPTIVSDWQTGDVLVMAPVNISEAAPGNPIETVSPQNSLIQDLATFNSRTTIWRHSLQRIRENPSILVWGTNTTELMINGTKTLHAHNSWLEVLLRMGLPGLAVSLIFTWQALWSSVVLLWNRQVDMWKKIISLLMLCILLSGFFEPTLFFTTISWNFVDFLFFLCLGYMLQWKKQICSKRSASGNV